METEDDDAHELPDTVANHGGTFIDGVNIYGDPNGTSESDVGSWGH